MDEASSEPLYRPGLRRSMQSVGETIDQGRGRIFPCTQCGADLEFSIGRQSLACPYCGHVSQLIAQDDARIEEQDYHAMLAQLELWRKDGHSAVANTGEHEINCESCGSNVVFAGTLTSTNCPYCASPLQRDKIHDATNRIPANAAIPFLMPQPQAHENLRNWVRSLWFAPNAFLRDGIAGKFQGSYLPFFTFDSMTLTRYAGQRGDHYFVTIGSGKERRTVRRVRWSTAAGQFQRFFDDVLEIGLQNIKLHLVERLEPWPLDRAQPYTPEFLAGLTARTYDKELEVCFERTRRRMEDALAIETRHRIGGDEQQIESFRVAHSAITFKHVLLPVWLMSYRYQGQVYQVMVNGATGKVAGERPWSWIKISLAVLGGLLVAGTVAALVAGSEGHAGGESFHWEFNEPRVEWNLR